MNLFSSYFLLCVFLTYSLTPSPTQCSSCKCECDEKKDDNTDKKAHIKENLIEGKGSTTQTKQNPDGGPPQITEDGSFQFILPPKVERSLPDFTDYSKPAKHEEDEEADFLKNGLNTAQRPGSIWDFPAIDEFISRLVLNSSKPIEKLVLVPIKRLDKELKEVVKPKIEKKKSIRESVMENANVDFNLAGDFDTDSLKLQKYFRLLLKRSCYERNRHFLPFHDYTCIAFEHYFRLMKLYHESIKSLCPIVKLVKFYDKHFEKREKELRQ